MNMMEQESMLTVSNPNSLHLSDSSLGASQALSNEEGNFNVWE